MKMAITIRPLRADEIDVRVDQVYYENSQARTNPKAGRYLLYKDARCDMNVLNETFGIFGWQREHKDINGVIYCGVSIKNPDTGEWVTKWDCGSESNVEKDKGASSDAFKRACVNWTIGKELYTAPTVKIEFDDYEKSHGGVIYGLKVTEIEYTNGIISKLVICDGRNDTRFSYGVQNAKQRQPQPAQPQANASQQKGKYPVPEEVVTSRKIKAVNDYLSDKQSYVAYYEAQFGGVAKASWTIQHYVSVYDSLVAAKYIQAVK